MTTDPEPSEAGAAWAHDHLQTDLIGWLTTRAPDGRLQSSPISFLWEDGTLLFYSQPDTPKLRNLARDPHVGFALQTDRYGLHVLIMEGTAVVDPSAPPSDRHPAYVAKFRDAYPHWGLEMHQTARDFCVAVRITPTRTRSW